MNVKILMAAACLSGALLIGGCGKPSVHVMNVAVEKEPFVLETKAIPEALHVIPVIPGVSGGIISEIPDIGRTVEAGEVLFQIDSSSYESQASALQAKIASSSVPAYTAPAPAADDSMEASLLRQGIITRAEYDKIQGRKGISSGNTAGGSAAPAVDQGLAESLAAIQRSIAACTVRAPISGVISQVYLGDTKMAAAGRPALVIRQDTPVTMTVGIPAKFDDFLEKAKDDKTLTVSLSSDADTWYGELKKQANDHGEKYTSYKVQVDNTEDQITIGSPYRLRIESTDSAPYIIIPKTALIGENTVAVVTDDSLIDMKTVNVGYIINGNVFILDGLNEGDRVVTDPSGKIEMGMQVDVKS